MPCVALTGDTAFSFICRYCIIMSRMLGAEVPPPLDFIPNLLLLPASGLPNSFSVDFFELTFRRKRSEGEA